MSWKTDSKCNGVENFDLVFGQNPMTFEKMFYKNYKMRKIQAKLEGFFLFVAICGRLGWDFFFGQVGIRNLKFPYQSDRIEMMLILIDLIPKVAPFVSNFFQQIFESEQYFFFWFYYQESYFAPMRNQTPHPYCKTSTYTFISISYSLLE